MQTKQICRLVLTVVVPFTLIGCKAIDPLGPQLTHIGENCLEPLNLYWQMKGQFVQNLESQKCSMLLMVLIVNYQYYEN